MSALWNRRVNKRHSIANKPHKTSYIEVDGYKTREWGGLNPFLRGWRHMVSLKRRRERELLVQAEADALIQELGPGAYAAARSIEREANSFSAMLYWHSVRAVSDQPVSYPQALK